MCPCFNKPVSLIHLLNPYHFSLVKFLFLMIKSYQIRVVFHQPLGLPHVRMYATAEFGRRRLPASKGADNSRSGGTTSPMVFFAICSYLHLMFGVTTNLYPLLGNVFRIKKYMRLDLRQKDPQTVGFGKFMKGLSGLPRKKKHFGVSCRSEIWSIHCCSHCWGMKDCESMSLAMQSVKNVVYKTQNLVNCLDDKASLLSGTFCKTQLLSQLRTCCEMFEGCVGAEFRSLELSSHYSQKL